MTKKEIIIIALIVIIGFVALMLSSAKEPSVGGSFSQVRGSTASSSVLTITTDGELLATSSRRLYARVVNNCASAIYLNTDGISASLTDGFYLAASGGVWDTGAAGTFTYTGAIHASSTNETSCKVYVEEYR